MRITLDIPEEFIREAAAVLGVGSRTDVVIVALRELVRRRRLHDLKAMAGTAVLEIDVSRSRRRPSPGARSR